jgi:hypothetical protein
MNTQENNLYEGIETSEDDELWLQKFKELEWTSIESIELASRALLYTSALTLSIYFLMIFITGIYTKTAKLFLYKFLLLTPPVAWVVSLIFSLHVFFPKLYQVENYPQPSFESWYIQLLESKHRSFKISAIFLIIGFVLLLIDASVFLFP